MIRQFELIEKVKAYDPKCDEDLLNRAYVYAMKAHGSQKRASGDPYFSHPLEVAGILSDMRMDSATIVTALLHDTVEDTHATLEEIASLFGQEIATLVDGVTKLTKLELQSVNTKQAENLRKLILAMSNDIRVLLVKLADRLHNMRTLHFVPSEEKRRRIARETLEIYAPLAERMGIHHIKDELEDLCFEILNPDGRESILNRLSFLEQEGGRALVERIIGALREDLVREGLEANVFGRLKKPYSIWRKMRDQNISIDQLSDIMAFRVLVANVSECYQALGILHGRYHVMPGRFKDYISTPKINQYQSLHTTLMGPENRKIEVQIRTKDMHDVAELGVAAHWQYKQGGAQHRESGTYKWLRGLLEIIEHAEDPEEFLEHTKLEIFQDQVFAFTPQGDLISLPRGATPIDFAYAIHSEVGNHCVGAIINGRMAPLRTILQNGDQVEIRTSKTQVPSPSWERIVRTGKARAYIRRFIRTQQRGQYVTLGRSLLQKEFSSARIDLHEKELEGLLSHYKLETLEDLYAHVGENLIPAQSVLQHIAPASAQPQGDADASKEKKARRDKEAKGQSMSIKGLIPGMAIHYAGCCHPLPGDKIVGIVMTGRGVTIHTYDCPNLQNYAHEPDRWIDVSWDLEDEQTAHIGRLFVLLAHKTGALAALTSVLSAHKANIVNLRFHSRAEDFYEVILDIEVKSSDHLSNILAALRASSFIQTVERMRS
ncbi:MAG: bifunctional (p)ppGpp synthetase/guanosine-3',5'-bis(diphosphate) 3'-pyrophosphohydrolase [Candidatus Puniceispirillum sp.]|nr:bifunctional (p)ppGpp synthetase/guanosine-3',5'-bis(diphosphate) 3'-pyrophosphohydrolase [Candidatus Puniceispirillum sp.]